MIDIFELIRQKCQDGVLFVPLGSALMSLTTGLNPRKFFALNTVDAEHYYITINEFHNGKIVVSDQTDKINDVALRLCRGRSDVETGDLLFSGTGTVGEVILVEDLPFQWGVKEGIYCLKVKKDMLLPAYLKYVLLCDFVRQEYSKYIFGGTVKSIQMADLKKIKIPLPPLQIQREIVAILDKFDAYCNSITAGLAGELEMRRKQYRYWRDKIFQDLLDEGCGMKAIGELGKFDRGSGLDKSMLQDEGDIPVIHYGQIYTTYNLKTGKTVSFLGAGTPVSVSAHHGDVVVCLTDTANLGFVGKAVAQICGVDVAISNDAGVLRLDRNEMDNVFLSYYMETGRFQAKKEMCKRGTTVMHLDIKSWQKIKVPVPDMARQREIVGILDKFRELECELELRRKQYGYYRDMLLAFPEQK